MSTPRSPLLPVEIVQLQPGGAGAFFRASEREALKTFYDFSVVWHEQMHDIAACSDGVTVGAIRLRIAASLCHVEQLAVLPENRRQGIGRELLERAADLAKYYNCHKMTALVRHESPAQQFFERSAYRQEAVLAQHTFKLDMAVMRRFLL